MFFVEEIKFNRVSVVGGAVSVSIAEKLAERRAKQTLKWMPHDKGYRAELEKNNTITEYIVRPSER